MSSNNDRLLRWHETGLKKANFYNLLAAGKLKAVKLGKFTCIWQSELDRYLRNLPEYKSAKQQSDRSDVAA